MALRLAAAVHALYASLSPSPADTASHPKPPSSSSSQKGPAAATATSRRRLATTIASTAALMASSRLLAPASARGGVDLRITVPEVGGVARGGGGRGPDARAEPAAGEAAHRRRGVAGEWEMQAELRASTSNLKQDLYAIINASPVSQRAELRRLYSNLFYSVTSLDYAAREKDERQVQEHYGNIVSALDEIFAKIM